MLLNFADGSPFASGRTGYNTLPGTETSAKITLVVMMGTVLTEVIVDTCADYVICAPEEADVLRHQSTESLGNITIPLHGRSIKGSLHRLQFSLVAEEGENLSFQAPAFLPDPGEQIDADLLPRSCLGLIGCLESMLFAVDPFQMMFYFG